MKVPKPITVIVGPRALAASLEACRQHALYLLADIEQAAARRHLDSYRAAERALGHLLQRLAQIVQQAPAHAAVASPELAERLLAAEGIYAALVAAAADIPRAPEPPRARRRDRPRGAVGSTGSWRTRTTVTLVEESR